MNELLIETANQSLQNFKNLLVIALVFPVILILLKIGLPNKQDLPEQRLMKITGIVLGLTIAFMI